jgi:Arc/MetJ-type ribon-helix-helix transcriptional regulator
MSKQIAVRLPDELVDFVDGAVAAGRAGTRASVVRQALERERRRAVAERDAATLALVVTDPEIRSSPMRSARPSISIDRATPDRGRRACAQ